MSKLKARRTQKGWSQSELSRQSGVNVRMIQHYEQGFKDINRAEVRTVIKLADALECDVKDLIEEGRDKND